MGSTPSHPIETQRLSLREVTADDARFMLELLNAPKFIKYIGDRGVRTLEESVEFIETRYRASYEKHGYGLYTVETKIDGVAVGICGFVRRDTLDYPDLGFAFLPEFERLGYGLESASAMMRYGGDVLGFKTVAAVTSQHNEASIKLLAKLGFNEIEPMDSPTGEPLRVFEYHFGDSAE